MKNEFAKSRNSQRRGVALVVVLAILAICLGLVVAFLIRSTSQVKASATLQQTGTAEELINTTLSLVTAQINFATSQGNGTSWASQPGMVRTFDTDGSLSRLYKLYSAESMVATSYAVGLDLPPSDWVTSPAIWTDLNQPAGGLYPILEPSALGAVDGFTQGTLPAGVNPGQMPVRWLYVLEDGSLHAPTGTTSVTITAAGPTNPIVGRIAFWTDDETCKVNVNTASQGTYWETPRANTVFEQNLARFQPAQREFQRYPGHPAMVDLGTVFPTLSTAQIYAITPKIVGGGSDGGTAVATAVLTPDSDRLYASLDEILLTPERNLNPVSKSQVAERQFLLTAHSRAPEVNLYEMPRVSIWPVQEGLAPANKVSVFDRLLAFASSINGEPYYFQRNDPRSATGDISIPRNETLLQYLEYLTSQPLPGFGGKFWDKYPDDHSQILTQIFDYIRSTNLEDGSLGAIINSFSGVNKVTGGFGQVTPSRRGATQGFGRFPVLSEVALHFIATADPAVSDSNDPSTNRTLGGVALTPGQRRLDGIMYMEFFIPNAGYPVMRPDFTIRVSGLNGVGISGVGAIGFPTEGVRRVNASGGAVLHGRGWGGTYSFRVPLLDSRLPARGAMPADSGSTAANTYPFVSSPFTVGTASGSMTLQGATLTVDVFAGSNVDVNAAIPVTTYTIAVPNWQTPIPTLEMSSPQLWTFSRDGVRAGHPGRIALPDAAISIFRNGDVVRSLIPSHSDYRLMAANPSTDTNVFVEHPSTTNTTMRAHALSEGARSHYFEGLFNAELAGPGITYDANLRPDYPRADPRSHLGDWDTGMSVVVDGPYVNMPDEGTIQGLSGGNVPYFSEDWAYLESGTTFFSPNRKLPSAGMFGSLPTGVKAGIPWRTLLFRPQTTHPAHSTTIPDHALLDLFWMPVVEPYAISDPFSTAGKINMNFQILPFTYIERSTALHALFASEKVAAIPNSSAATFKLGPTANNPNIRLDVDAEATLAQFRSEFGTGRVFRSASQICDLHIVPVGQTAATMDSFWSNHRITGENLRERAYTTLYPRLTTQSNTFTVHYRVQALNVPKLTGNTFDETRDQIAAERRGSITVERFLDPNNTNIPDYASIAQSNPTTITNGTAPRLNQFYQWRTVETRRFPSP